jgi:hypothetical protein
LGSLDSAMNEAIPRVPPEGQTKEWKALKPRVKAAMCQTGHKAVWKACGNLGEKWEIRQESE